MCGLEKLSGGRGLSCSAHAISRRRAIVFGGAAAMFASTSFAVSADSLPYVAPGEVASVPIPRTPIALKAAAFAQKSYPPFLFNHCMRTYLFGALALRRQGQHFDMECAFAAAMLHDLGLMPQFASPSQSFELDGANRAESLVRSAGASGSEADIIWHAVELHDTHWPLVSRQGPEAQIVAIGAAGDVDGLDDGVVDDRQLAEILAAFPRLQFKKRFTALLIDHCKRKPTSQRGTWLEGLCREQAPAAWSGSVEQDVAKANFAE
jgi:hypothetical protein